MLSSFQIVEVKFKSYFSLRFFALACIGLANAIPIPLMGSTLTVWLTESGYTKETIGLFALLGIPFSLKLLWNPIVDHIRCPIYPTKPRKGWVLLGLFGMAFSILGISSSNPITSQWLLVGCILLLSLFIGCLYIVGISYELESLEETTYSLGSSSVIIGYRLGLLCAAGGALYLSSIWGWRVMFQCMAALLCFVALIIVFRPEPYKSQDVLKEKRKVFAQYKSIFHAFWNEILAQPCLSFFQRSDWQVACLFLLTFKFGDQLTLSMENPFYLSLGFTKTDLASASKLCGIASTISGAFLTGLFLRGKNPMIFLGKFAFIHSCTLSCYLLFLFIDQSITMLYSTSAIQNFTAGMAMTAFIAFLWKVCDKRYAAVQYALLWSLFSFKSDILASLGGLLAGSFHWETFFSIVTISGMCFALTAWMLLLKTQQKVVCDSYGN